MNVVRRVNSLGMRGFTGNGISGGRRIQLGVKRQLGATGQEWYDRAKRSMATFADLYARVPTIANQQARTDILAWVGNDITVDSPYYKYQSVKADVEQNVESFKPPNTFAYDIERRQDRVVELEEVNVDFSKKVGDALGQYGIIPAAQTITIRETIERQRPGPEPKFPDLTLPLALVGGGIILAILLS